MRWGEAAWKMDWHACGSFATFLGVKMCMWNCSGIFDRAEEARNHAAVEIARKLGLPLLATNGVCYAQPERREVLDVFTCLRHHRTLETAGRLLARNSERHLKSPEEMARFSRIFPKPSPIRSWFPRACNSICRIWATNFRISGAGRQIAGDFLRERTMEGMIYRYGFQNEKARPQIENELEMIERLELEGYFLIVWDIVRFCRERNILVQGRGSAANSAVCYALGITAVDPVGMDLLFERFLSEERGEWPDIDLDLAQRRSARARHSVCVRALRKIRRGDDRQCDHLSRAFGGARNRQSAFVRSGNARSSDQSRERLGIQRARTTRSTGISAMRDWICSIRRFANFSSCA